MKHLDLSSIGTILLTVILFVIAIFEKGFTHELLLEAGVFLVSVKLIHAAYKSSVNVKRLEDKLDQILTKLSDLE